jgi:hypothetical protein
MPCLHLPCRRKNEYEIHKVAKIVAHPNFKASTPQQSNLALVVLQKASRQQPVALPAGW